MAAPRKPTRILEMSGALKKNPDRGRARENEPEENGEIGSPPAHFTASELQAWSEICENAFPGVLCLADRHWLEQTSTALAALRELRAERAFCKDPDRRIKVMQIINQTQVRVEKGLAALGMSPADRSRVAAPKKEKAKGFQVVS